MMVVNKKHWIIIVLCQALIIFYFSSDTNPTQYQATNNPNSKSSRCDVHHSVKNIK
jgi:hypothetical protein